MRTSLGIFCIVAFALVSTGAFAQDTSNGDTVQPVMRSCTDADLAGGVFKMIKFSETPERGEAHWVQMAPYHYLTFRPNKGWASMAYNMDIKSAKAMERDFRNDPSTPGSDFYALSKDGALTLVKNEKIVYLFRCTFVIKKNGIYLPGDLILTGYTKKRKSLLYKLYRRWYTEQYR